VTLTRKVVSDLETLKAMTHPLRIRLIGELRRSGPATASELGRRLGESSGATSYHLRQLERFGYVADDEVQPSGRERRWRALHDQSTLPDELWAAEGGPEAFRALQRIRVEHLMRGLAAWTEPGPGRDYSDYLLRLDAGDARALLAELDAVISSYSGRDGDIPIHLHVLALPDVPA
jgi:DNA-binding transcriptional ArsR family regulator